MQNRYTVIEKYIDGAISDKDTNKKPEFQRIISDRVKRQFVGALVYSLTASLEIIMIWLLTKQNSRKMAYIYFLQKKILPMTSVEFLWSQSSKG